MDINSAIIAITTRSSIKVNPVLFVVVEAGIETGGWKPEIRVSGASFDTSIDNLKRGVNPSFLRIIMPFFQGLKNFLLKIP